MNLPGARVIALRQFFYWSFVNEICNVVVRIVIILSIGNTNRYAYDLQQPKLAIPSLNLKGKSTYQERSYGLIHCSLWSSRSECAAKLTNATFYLWRCVSKRNVRPLRPKKSLKENCFLPKGNARFLAACAPSFRMSSPIVNSFTLQRLLSFAFLTANGTLP